MKKNVVSEISNVKEMKEMVKFLANRPVEHMQGLGMIYGFWALGKTYFPAKAAQKFGWIYYQLDANESAKSFVLKLYDKIYFAKNDTLNEFPPRGSANSILGMCIDMLQKSPQTIVIDEIDYAINNRLILETIKTIVDKTFSEIIMIGMDNSKSKLLRKAPYIHSRVCYWVEAKPLTLEDVAIVCNDICEVKLDAKLVEHLHKLCKGRLRELVKQLHVIECVALPNGIKELTYAEYMGK
ncbi:MAG: hypothetical protein B7C24_14290 [Bacteroidetes bacterium 4572_77]|nr:MAG: hypothetical protein B7C24_14290 [Bacteroidetes bacterium 4572_77]